MLAAAASVSVVLSLSCDHMSLLSVWIKRLMVQFGIELLHCIEYYRWETGPTGKDTNTNQSDTADGTVDSQIHSAVHRVGLLIFQSHGL